MTEQAKPQYTTYDDMYRLTPSVVATMLALRKSMWDAVIGIELALVDAGAIRPEDRWALNQQQRAVYARIEVR